MMTSLQRSSYVVFFITCLQYCACVRELHTTLEDQGDFGAGKLFVFAFPSHNRNYDPRLLITTWSEDPVYVTISQFAGVQYKQVRRGTFVDVSFKPLTDDIEIQSCSVTIAATDYVYVYATAVVAILERVIPIYNHVLADGFLAVPVTHFGTEYYVVSWAPNDNWPSTFVVTALDEPTTVKIHFSGGSRGDKSVSLKPYETYYCMDYEYDLSGTFIQSDKPVSVISSQNCACVPNNTDIICLILEGCAPLSEMMLPASSGLGTSFVVSAFPTYSLGFVLRVVGSQPSTKVHVRGNFGPDIDRTVEPGTFTDFKFLSNTSTMVILTSKPVLVVQYPMCTNATEGSAGSFMILIPPTDQYSSDVIVPIHKGDDPVQNLVSITSKCEDQAYLELNNSPLRLISGHNMSIDDWCIFHVEVADGLHKVTHIGEDNIRFFVLVYGFLLDKYDTGIAFGYAAARGRHPEIPSTTKPIPTTHGGHTTHGWRTMSTADSITTAIPSTGGTRWQLILEIAVPSVGCIVVLLFICVYYVICRCCGSAGGFTQLDEDDDDTYNGDDVISGPQVAAASPAAELPCYKMDSKPRGLCVIINNMYFRDVSWQRNGSDIDAGRLIRTFTKLHFKIITKNDLTAQQMMTSLRHISEINHNPYDAFVCCILTHGQFKAELFGTDMKFIKIQHILNLFTSDKCASLAGKPKVFFIQACEGWAPQTATNSRTVRDNPPSTGPAIELLYRSPTHADFLLGYSTVPGCYAFRNTTGGSWYISALVEALGKHGTEEIMTILQAVNETMRMRQPDGGDIDGEEYSQIAAPVMSLSKRLYFARVTTDETCTDGSKQSNLSVNDDLPSDPNDNESC